ncbi:unnamed protein product [Ceutorhynchus assimilis]|uniref:BZIP domain-containing protein n=1 Tax=Ceutorhynchus assimilis TaxID=467358 RepID=A0A9N9MMG1_9CUCU|nr:unnamed protein product [Ceutorhynchus assimilis]
MMWYENVNVLPDNFTQDYLFKSSPESCSTDNSFVPDNFEGSSESISDEDFMTQLSSDLDIPLLLNPGDDEMGILSSFLDKSPDEILSEVTPISPYLEDCDMKDDIDIKELDLFLQDSIDNVQLTELNDNNIKTEVHSDESCSSRNSVESSTPPPYIQIKKSNSPPLTQVPNILPKQEFVKTNPQSKVAIKRIPIKPRVPPANSNIVLIKDLKTKFTPNNCNKIVVLDNISVNNINGLSYVNKSIVNIPQVTVNNNNRNIDPKMLKRQERRIKNRESASISRKKKKEYLTMLEDQVQALKNENQRLTVENKCLRERLSMYETTKKLQFDNIAAKISKPAIVLCAFLLVVGINLNLGNFTPGFKPDLYKTQSNSLKVSNHYGRNLLWAPENNNSNEFENKTYFSPLPMCPASINQTESARLLLELEKWIGKPDDIPAPPPTKPKPNINKMKRKKLRLDMSLAQIKKQERFGPDNEARNEIQVFSPKEDVLYSDFFDAINRQGDTFYVVSFSDQHMLLPALHHNKTRRPKMSLLMPFVFPNDTSTQTYFPLMQIDCEVLDTKLVHINYATIPSPYRQYGNFTKQTDKDEADVKSKEKYRPYFLDKSNN